MFAATSLNILHRPHAGLPNNRPPLHQLRPVSHLLPEFPDEPSRVGLAMKDKKPREQCRGLPLLPASLPGLSEVANFQNVLPCGPNRQVRQSIVQ